MSIPAELITFILGLAGGIAASALYFDRVLMGRRIAELEKQNQKMQDAQRKHLPYEKLEQLENMMAALVAMKNDRDIENKMLDNALEWARMVREDRREK